MCIALGVEGHPGNELLTTLDYTPKSFSLHPYGLYVASRSSPPWTGIVLRDVSLSQLPSRPPVAGSSATQEEPKDSVYGATLLALRLICWAQLAPQLAPVCMQIQRQ
jgi:hypothetical protein